MSASLIGRLGSSAFRPSTTAVSMSLAGSCFSTKSAHRPFHHGIRRRGGTIFWAALPSAGPSGHANSPHPSSREGHHSTAWWSSSFLLALILLSAHAITCLVHRNSAISVGAAHRRALPAYVAIHSVGARPVHTIIWVDGTEFRWTREVAAA